MTARLFTLFALAFGLSLAGRPEAAAARPGPSRPLILISDIDDTIKRTNVLSKKGVVLNGPRTTNPFVGMSELYVQFACDTVPSDERERCVARQSLTHAQNRHVVYVTAAKGSLQMFGALFLKRNAFPVGLFIGREHSDADMIDSLAGEDSSERYPHTLEYKIQTIQKLLVDYPEFDFIMVGDNGEKDVAAYDAVYKWAAKKHPYVKIHSFIHQVYDWAEGAAPAASQTLYVTGGDLALELYRRGLVSEYSVAKAIEATMKGVKLDSSEVFPNFMNCRPFLEPGRFPQMPDRLSAPVVARAEKLFIALKKYCSR